MNATKKLFTAYKICLWERSDGLGFLFHRRRFQKRWEDSTWKQGIEIAHEADIEHILMAHYNSEYTDSFLYEQEKIACEDRICIFSKEGMRLRI